MRTVFYFIISVVLFVLPLKVVIRPRPSPVSTVIVDDGGGGGGDNTILSYGTYDPGYTHFTFTRGCVERAGVPSNPEWVCPVSHH